MSAGSTEKLSWFPGHMAAGMRAVLRAAPLIDLVVEVRDARLPAATAVAHLHAGLKRKPVIVLLNREDLAQPAATQQWLVALRARALTAFAGVGTRAASLRPVRNAILTAGRRHGRLRVAVVGAPNTGKSSVINALAHRKRAVAQDRAGITRHTGWLRLADGIDVLDTPGVLAPRITGEDAAWQLALCGSLPDAAFDAETVVERFAAWLREHRPKLAHLAELEEFARSRGMRRRGGEIDRAAAARTFIALFRDGGVSRFTFEGPEKLRDV